MYIFQGRQSKNNTVEEEKGNASVSPNGVESDPLSTFQEEPLLVDDLVFGNLLGEQSADVSSTSNDLDFDGYPV